MEESGRVVRVEGQFAWVETARRSACHSCSAQAGCGTGLIGRLLGSRRSQVRVLNTPEVQIGDEVVLGMEEQALVRGSIAVYALPLLALIGGALLFEWLAPLGLVGDGAAVAGGVGGFAAGVLWLRRFAHRVRNDERYQPVILRRTRSTVTGSDGVLLP